MRSVWIAAPAIGAVAIVVAKAFIGDMVQEEARTRLHRIPFALIRMAITQVPRELRDDLAAEWTAELAFVLSGTEGLPVTGLVRGIRYSVGLLLAALAITDGLERGNSNSAGDLGRIVIGCASALLGSAGVADGILLVARHGLTITEFAGGACMTLRWATSGAMLALGKFAGFPPPFLLACASNVTFYVYQGDPVRLAWPGLGVGVVLRLPGSNRGHPHGHAATGSFTSR